MGIYFILLQFNLKQFNVLVLFKHQQGLYFPILSLSKHVYNK